MWFSKRRAARVGDELRFHRDRLIDAYVAAGMERREAERRAFLEFGNLAQIEESVRDVRGRWLDDTSRDLRYAIRTLRRDPGFTAVAVLSLALGIGANTAIFSLVNAVLLRPLPVDEPNRLVQIARTSNGRPGQVSYPLFEYFRDNVRSIAGAFAERISEQAIVIDGEDEFVTAELVSGAYYNVLGLVPAAGRLLGAADDSASAAAPAAVISEGYWQRRFGRSPSAVGKTFIVGGRVFTIVGVTPASYQGVRTGYAPDVTLPILLIMSEEERREVSSHTLRMLARLKPGATVEQANAEVQVLWSAFLRSQAAGASEKERAGILRQRAAALPAPDGFNQFRDNLGPPLLILMAIVALILMLVCINLSGLLLSRAAARQREISIRLAIGAGRGRLVRQFLTESLLLAAAGALLAITTAGWLSARLFALFAEGRDVVLSVAPDWRVFAFTAAVALVACLIAGLAPARHALLIALNPALKEVRAQRHGRFGRGLVVAQLAMSMVLIVAATLFVGTLVKLYGVDPGFNSNGLLVVQVSSNQPYPPARALAVQSALLEGLKTLPDVRSASAAQVLPISGNDLNRTVQVEGYAFRPGESEHVGFNVIAPDYFATLGTPLISGREFTGRDTPTSPKVVIVNETFARHFFGSESALGRHVSSLSVTYEIVGVVRDAKYESLRDAIKRTMYVACLQRDGDQPSSYRYLARISGGEPSRLVPSVEQVTRQVDPGLRVRTAMTYATLVNRSIAAERLLATLGGFFGLLALIVAGLGIFGVLAFQVARRTNEIGVRMALGASRWAMTRLVLHEVVWMVVAGASIGAGAAILVTGVVRNLLFGLTPTDPSVFAVAASVLAAAALLSGWLPARRASRVDPLVALRHE